MATTFVKVEDKDKVQELWEAGLLWAIRAVDIDCLPPPELRHVPRSSNANMLMLRWSTDYGYLVED